MSSSFRRGLLVCCALVATGVSALSIWAFLSISPSEVLVYANPDAFGRPLSAIARARASLWKRCPTEAFRPNTSLGAVAASLDAPSTETRRSASAVARSMVAAGCSVDEYDEQGLTPLHAAVLYGSPSAVGLLLDLGADPAKTVRGAPFTGLTALGFARALESRPAGRHGNRGEVIKLLAQIEK